MLVKKFKQIHFYGRNQCGSPGKMSLLQSLKPSLGFNQYDNSKNKQKTDMNDYVSNDSVD